MNLKIALPNFCQLHRFSPRPRSLDARPKVPREPERAAVVASSGPTCAVCGGVRESPKREACSDKCRAERSRRRRQDALRVRDDEIRRLLPTALKKLEEDRDESASVRCRSDRRP